MSRLKPILRSKFIVQEDGCWIWKNPTETREYGDFAGQPAHVRIYQELVGPIPLGHETHHTCEVKLCVNPDHIEVVTRLEHKKIHRKTHCIRGHEFNEENTRLDKKTNIRYCRACRRERYRINKNRSD